MRLTVVEVEFSKLGTGIATSYDPPAMLGRYELLGTIGSGGMATVYLARTAGEAGFQRLFAIKVLHPHLAKEEGFVTMLLDEARIAARLHHPNVVPIVDLGSSSGLHFVAMEYVEGCSLSALFKRKREERPTRLVLPLLLDMLTGLEAAHTLTDDDGKPMNLVHRDVSPQNTLVGADGIGRITDFGIARAESRINNTRPGQVKGKYAYMSPEQVRARPVDRRSDVFSCGVMLWSMLTARKLFQGDNDAVTMGNIVELDIPLPSTVGLRPPAVFDAIALKALERDPDRRYATAQEMEEALREAASQAGGLAPRREVSAWVTDAFREELAARRAAIRATVSSRSTGTSVSAVRAASQVELPTFTPSGGSAKSMTPVPTRAEQVSASEQTIPEQPAVVEVSQRMPSMAGPSLKRRIAILAVAPLTAILVLVVWLAVRSSHKDLPASGSTPASTATTETNPAAAAAAAAAAPITPASEPVSPPQAPVAPAIASVSAGSATAPTSAGSANAPTAPTAPTAPARRRPAPQPPARVSAARAASAPSKTQPATASPPPPKPAEPPASTTPWDKDSPTPPQ